MTDHHRVIAATPKNRRQEQDAVQISICGGPVAMAPSLGETSGIGSASPPTTSAGPAMRASTRVRWSLGVELTRFDGHLNLWGRGPLEESTCRTGDVLRMPRSSGLVSAFRFVEREKAVLPVTAMCRVLGVSPSGYWAWSHRLPSERARGDAALTERIRAIHERSGHAVPRRAIAPSRWVTGARSGARTRSSG